MYEVIYNEGEMMKALLKVLLRLGFEEVGDARRMRQLEGQSFCHGCRGIEEVLRDVESIHRFEVEFVLQDVEHILLQHQRPIIDVLCRQVLGGVIRGLGRLKLRLQNELAELRDVGRTLGPFAFPNRLWSPANSPPASYGTASRTESAIHKIVFHGDAFAAHVDLEVEPSQ